MKIRTFELSPPGRAKSTGGKAAAAGSYFFYGPKCRAQKCRTARSWPGSPHAGGQLGRQQYAPGCGTAGK